MAGGSGYRGSTTREAQWLIGPGWLAGECSLPLSDAAGQLVDIEGGWACKMAGSGRVSSAVAHVSKHRLGTRRGDSIADQPPGMGDHRPTVGCSWTIGRRHGQSAHLMSAQCWPTVEFWSVDLQSHVSHYCF